MKENTNNRSSSTHKKISSGPKEKNNATQQGNYYVLQRKQLTTGYKLIMKFSAFILVSQQIDVSDLTNDSRWRTAPVAWPAVCLCVVKGKPGHNEA